MLHIPNLPPDNMFNYLETVEIPEDLYLFITLPSMADASMVPSGYDLLLVGVSAPNDLSKASQSVKL